MICDDESTAIETANTMRTNDHTILCILDDDITDDRLNHIRSIKSFEKGIHRMLITTTFVWTHTKPLLQAYVLPYQDLIIYNSLDHCVAAQILKWLEESEEAGFISSNLNILSV